jgi:DnaK suppressor protein
MSMDTPPGTTGPAQGPDHTLQAERKSALVAEMARVQSVVVDLEAELEAIAESTRTSPDDEHDAEGSTVGFERARVTGLLDRERRHLAELAAALARLGDSSDGRCASCGELIPAERLAALPSTRTCVNCADTPMS